MRADRLLALLMLLQSRGRTTAKALASELEVCERTVYRDIDALSAAGVPIYGEPGREGGFALIDSYRTSLTGMTDGELQALFAFSIPMLSLPGPLADLGLGQDLRAALLKLAGSLPEERRNLAASSSQRVHLDPSSWEEGEEPVPHLQTLYQAICRERRVRFTFRPLFHVLLELLVEPYGLVARAGIWYLVCTSHGRLRVQAVANLIDVQVTDENFTRPPGFDLQAAWEDWCTRRTRDRVNYKVSARISPEMLPFLPMYFGAGIRKRIAEAGAPDPQGRVTLELSFESFEAARDRLLAFGRAVEVIAPRALRVSLRDYGEQIATLYRRSLQE